MNKKLVSLIIGTFFALTASLSMGALGVSAAGMTVTTDPSPTVSGTAATFTGSYSATTAGTTETYFRWGTTTSLGSSTPTVDDTNLSDTMTATVTGLTPGATYYFQAYAISNAAGPGHGSTISFTVGGATAPSADTMSSTVTSSSATLNGAFNGNGSPSVQTEFIWGTSATALYSSTGFVTQSAAHGNFSANISGLTPGTTYYFEAVAKTDYSTVYAPEILPFTTTTGGGSGTSCSINSFTSSSPSVAYGGVVTLSWNTSGCVSGSIDNSVGAATPISAGSKSGILYSTTTFTLTALDSSGNSVTQSVTVSINGTTTGGGTGTGGSCSITSFSAASPSIAYGGNTTLSWNTSGDCTGAYISPTIGTVAVSGSANTGALYASTSYTLTVTDSSSTTYAYANVSVGGSGTGTGGGTGGSTCTISSFNASPSSIGYGGTTVLYWTTNNCASVSIDNGIGGGLGLSSSTTTPALYASTWFTLTATDYYGSSVTNQIFVGVTSGGTSGYGTTTGYGTTGYGTTGGYGNCAINSFTVSPTTVTSGQSATITWNTYGCTSANISGGSLYSTFEPASGSITTGPLYGTTTFSIYGNGGVSTSQQVVAYVTNSPYPYSYTCGNGNYSDPSCGGQYAGTFITIPATNVGSTSARLNGIANNLNTPFVAYFEYGTTPSLGQATVFQNTSPEQSYNFYDTINTLPGTTYYYRAAGQVNGTIIRGNILSFTSAPASATPIVYVGGSSSTVTETSATSSNTATPAGVTLTITDQNDNINIGDTVDYTVTYTNGTNKTLSDAVLSVILPLGFTVKQTTQGTMINPTTVTANLGTLAPGQTGSVFIEATVEPNTPQGQTLVTNGTLSYALPNGTHDSAVGYVLNHASGENVFAGFALGSGFFPSTIWGWFFTIIIILIIILIARRITRAKHAAGHGGGHDDHGGHAAPKH